MSKIVCLLLLGVLTACQQNQQSTTPFNHQSTKKYAQATILSGVVSHAKGRVKNGKINATTESQQILATANIDDHGHYDILIPANTVLPIILNFQSESEQLRVVIIDPALSKYDISPLTTSIADKAKAMGGYTRSNLVIAAENSVHVPDANKTSAGFRGDPTTQYGGWH